jgi:hypothetical protein
MTQPRKTGRPRIEDRHKTNEARKPWLKLEMLRRTWYRRQAEKRALPRETQVKKVARIGMDKENDR